MHWHDIRDPKDPELDRLASEHNLHVLHMEDCRNRNQAAKVESQNQYVFIVLKPVQMDEDYCLHVADLDFFIGNDWLITVQEESCPSVSTALDRAHTGASKRSDEVFYRILDSVVDSYQPIIDRISDRIDEMEDRALSDPDPDVLEEVFDLKRALIVLRRIIANTRDVVGHLLRNEFSLIRSDLTPFFRDVYDHLMRNLDLIEIQRDLLTGTTELYLSSIANRTNAVMKVLTVFGTIATPALVITGMYGMNLRNLPFADHAHSWGIVMALIGAVSLGMLAILRWLRML